MSQFIKDQIEKRLAELRYNCGLQRLHLRNAHERKWGDGKYWDDLQAKAQVERPKDVAAADKELADFIAEHRSIMGADWIGNDHGRLCWASFLGGLPIDQHYCQRDEGHDGHHADEAGAWPQNVTNCYEWNKLRASCAHAEKANNRNNETVCAACGEPSVPSVVKNPES